MKLAKPIAVLLLAGSAVIPATAQAAPAHQARGAATKTVTVRLGAEAWYSSPRLCVLTVCLPVASPLTQTYPAGTLHIAAAAGAESARTYLSLRKPLARGTLVKTGTLRLPLDTNPADGSVAPDLARVEACTTAMKIKNVAGATTTPPKVNCRKAPASRVIGTPATELDIDLKPIAPRLAHRGVSLALLPVLSPGATFDVTVSTTKHPKSAASRPVLILTSAIRTTKTHPQASAHSHPHSTTPDQSSGTSSGGDAGSAPVQIPSGPLDTGTQTTQGPSGGDTQPQIAPEQSQAALRLAVGPHSFDYPVVFLLPLLILAGLIGFGRQLTKPLTGAGDRSIED